MLINNYKKRIVDDKVERYLKLFGAVCIEGPKYCGKTWVGRYHSKSETLMFDNTGEESSDVQVSKVVPDVVLEGEKPRLIDEWQVAPNLWDTIRYDVDKSGLKGQYILTGSSTPKRNGISHSGAGRFGKIQLRTMSLYESGDSSGLISLKDICDGKFVSKGTGEVNIRDLAHYTIRGGWPSCISYSSDDARTVVKEYIDLIIDDDLYKLDGVTRDKHKVRLLLKSLARNESTTVSNSTIKNDIKEIDYEDVDIDTLASYLDALNRLYLFDNDEPFSIDIRSSIRVKKSEKRHFADPSIACALMNLTVEKLIRDLKTFGFLFESLVERDLKIYADSFGGKVFHYQDYLNREIDSVIELEDGEWCAFEVKLGTYAIEEASKNLLKISNSIKESGGRPPKVLCVICGMSKYAYMRPDGVYVVPITALKN